MSQYLKPDSELGYVEDHAMIEFLQFNNLRHSILGCMLGNFNEVGDYVVAPEIVEELVLMEKYLVQTYDNIELCKSCLKLDKQISFMVTFEGNRATLSLVEKLNYEANFKLNSGSYSNINEYVLDSVETSGEINRNVIYDRWNIKLIPGEVIDIFNCDDSILEKYFGIVNRFKYLLEANKVLLQKEDELEEVEASYSNELLDILKHYPKLEKAVMQTIKETLEEKKDAVSVKKPFFAKTFNEVLENAIEKNLNILEKNEQKEFEQEKRNAVVNVNIKRADALDIEKVEAIETSKEVAPKILQLNMKSSYESKHVEELGTELVSVNKQVTDKLMGEKEDIESDLIRRTIVAVGEKKGVEVVLPKKPEEKCPEKDKLIATIVGAGLGAVVGGPSGAVVGAVAGATIADIAKEVKQDQKQNAKKSAPAVKSPAKKDGGVKKSSGGGKGTGSKGKKSDGGKGKGDKSKVKGDISKTTEQKKEIRFGIYSSPSMGVLSEENKIDVSNLRLRRTQEKGVKLYKEDKMLNGVNSERNLLGDMKKIINSPIVKPKEQLIEANKDDIKKFLMGESSLNSHNSVVETVEVEIIEEHTI